MAITREKLKTEIDNVPEQDLETLHRIIKALSRTAQSSPPTQQNTAGWHTFVEQMYGSLASDPIVREPQGDYETREDMD